MEKKGEKKKFKFNTFNCKFKLKNFLKEGQKGKLNVEILENVVLMWLHFIFCRYFPLGRD